MSSITSNLQRFWAEIRRRKVHKVTIAYSAVAWLLIEISSTVFPALLLPDWTHRLVVILALIGLPVVIVLAWVFDSTPEGVVRTDTNEMIPGAKARPRLPAVSLVGREVERKEMMEAFHGVKGGRGVLVGISGEPGMGKSTLAEDFIGSMEGGDDDCLIGRGRSSERLAGATAYLPVVEALTDLVRADETGKFAKTLRKFAPSWHGLIFTGHDQDDKEAVFEASSQDRLKRELGWLFEHFGSEKLLVIMFEDFQWADVSTVDALVYLADRFGELRLLLIITYRESEILQTDHPFRQARLNMQSRGLSREIKLDMLNKGDLDALLTMDYANHQFPPEFSEKIFSRTGGHPLFTTDLINYLENSGSIIKDDDIWVLNSSLEEIEKGLPDTVRTMVERKMSGIPEDEQRLLGAAAVQGFEFDSAVLARVLELDPGDVEEKLEELERVHSMIRLIDERQMPDRTLSSRYEFSHVLYLDYCFSTLRPTRKAEKSRLAAEALEQFYGSQATEIAPQLAALFEAAGNFEKSADYYLAAATNATSVFAHKEAAMMARNGLKMVSSVEPSPERNTLELQLLLAHGGALCMTQGYASKETAACFDSALELTETFGMTDQDPHVIWGLWMVYAITGNCSQSGELSNRLMQMTTSTDDPMLIGAAHYAEAITHEIMGSLQKAMSQVEQLQQLEAPGSNISRMKRFVVDPFVSGRGIHLRLLALMGFSDQASSLWEENHSRAKEDQLDPRSICDLLIAGCCYQAFCRNPKEVRELAEETIEVCEEFDIYFERQWAEFWLGWAMTEFDSPDEGFTKMRAFITLITSSGTLMHHSLYFATLAEALQKANHIEEARDWIRQGISLVEQTGQSFYESELHRISGELDGIHGGDSDNALASLRRSVEIAGTQDAQLLEARAALSLSKILRLEGDTEEEKCVLQRVCARLREEIDSPEYSQIQLVSKEIL